VYSALASTATVTTSGASCSFMCAICSSKSKSETARRPLTRATAPSSRATLTTRVSNARVLTLVSPSSSTAAVTRARRWAALKVVTLLGVA
jgi:formylmethanofuran:tetrahydromethanopterin formyltransferase